MNFTKSAILLAGVLALSACQNGIPGFGGGKDDAAGGAEANLGLGAKRASAVNNYLTSRGVAQNRLETVTFGKERPLAICSDETCWAKNRRAVTLVAGGLGS